MTHPIRFEVVAPSPRDEIADLAPGRGEQFHEPAVVARAAPGSRLAAIVEALAPPPGRFPIPAVQTFGDLLRLDRDSALHLRLVLHAWDVPIDADTPIEFAVVQS